MAIRRCGGAAELPSAWTGTAPPEALFEDQLGSWLGATPELAWSSLRIPLVVAVAIFAARFPAAGLAVAVRRT